MTLVITVEECGWVLEAARKISPNYWKIYLADYDHRQRAGLAWSTGSRRNAIRITPGLTEEKLVAVLQTWAGQYMAAAST